MAAVMTGKTERTRTPMSTLPEHDTIATLHADNLRWTLHMSREFPQPREATWDAITKADAMARWAPYRPNADVLAEGEYWLTPVDGSGEDDVQGTVTEVAAPASLAYLWDTDPLRFDLEERAGGTVMTFAHTFDDRNSAASMAAGWHLCFAALEMLLAGDDVPQVTGERAKDHGWEDLQRAYADRFDADDERGPEPMEDL
jgi:uncharacterized protein YndB with AHSA1/START domain